MNPGLPQAAGQPTPGRSTPREISSRARHVLRSLRHRNFRLFLLGQVVSLTGTWMQSLAQGWLVWRLTHSAWLLGVVGFAQMGPVLVLGLVGGLAADRFDRWRLVVCTQCASLLQAASLATLVLSGHIAVGHVLALAAVLGAINAFDMPARQAFLVQMVGPEDLPNAIALNSTTFNGARVVGPSLAGLVVAAWGEGVCFALNAVTYAAVIGSLFAMRLPKRAQRHGREGAVRRLSRGLAYAWHTPHVRALLSLTAVSSIFGMSYNAFVPAFAGEVLHRDARGLGVLMGSIGVGAMLGALLMAARQGIHGLARTLGAMAVLFGAAITTFGLSRTFGLSCAAVAVVGFSMVVQLAGTNTLLQSLVPDDMRGRLMSFYTVVFVGFAPIGSLLQGRLAAAIGVQHAVVIGGAITMLAGTTFALWARNWAQPGPIPPLIPEVHPPV
ncbi:MAG: MFS transporter [Acidobacteria bacterium]|nr:MFS transporter [Acidobacteriota bacterium]